MNLVITDFKQHAQVIIIHTKDLTVNCIVMIFYARVICNFVINYTHSYGLIWLDYKKVNRLNDLRIKHI